MHIGIIYNLTGDLLKGKESDRVADCEVLEVAAAVRAALEGAGHSVGLYNVCRNGLAALAEYDAIFNLAESTLGSDVTEDEIAEKLEAMGIIFTGSGATTLRRCVDKAWTKAVLIEHNILTPAFRIIRDGGDVRTGLGFPLFVKPVHEDGSIGIDEDSIVWDEQQLMRKAREVLDVYRQPALVEEYIDGREINAAVLGNGSAAQVLPLSEIVFSLRTGRPHIVSFAAKWLDDTEPYQGTRNGCPAKLDASIETAIRETALKACRVMGCTDYARVDIRLRSGMPYVLEVNPNPCINPDGAGYVVSASAAGLDYNQLICHILNCALTRQPARRPGLLVPA